MSYFAFDLKKSKKKCAVIGCHTTGGTIAHALAVHAPIDELVLIDQDRRIADGQVADILGALPDSARLDVWAGEYADLGSCDLIVLSLGLPALHESAHADLIELNAPLIRQAVGSITTYNSDAVLLVVSDPTEAMTQIALRYSGLPASRVLGVGTLPISARLCSMLAQYLGADINQVQALVLGSADELAVLLQSQIYVSGMPLHDYLKAIGRSEDTGMFCSLLDDAIFAYGRACDVKGRADHSVAHACVRLADAIFNDRNMLLSPCVEANGYCELTRVSMSLPCLVGRHGARIVHEILPASAELEQLYKAAARQRAQLFDYDRLTEKNKT
ncbi:MAG: hypothetical protein E7594_08645 [Ruminococcaceae bacterium]|nr:hypothetical protein [Oscillospiraceae bacterium]